MILGKVLLGGQDSVWSLLWFALGYVLKIAEDLVPWLFQDEELWTPTIDLGSWILVRVLVYCS